MRSFLIAMTLALVPFLPSKALAFDVVKDESSFVNIVVGKQLTRLGIKLDVTRDGEIRGRAFGKPVFGEWRWENGYFCRSLYHGQKDLGPNCQQVKVKGNKVRFTSDRGTGIYADLTLR